MAFGHKTGGRARGAPNRRTQEAAQILDELGCNPIRGMAEIAMSESHPIELRARMFLELEDSCLYGCFSKPQDVGVEVIASCPGHARGGCGRKA